MALPLDLKSEKYRIDAHEVPKSKEFPGPNREQMPILERSGRYPVSVYDIIHRKVELRRAPFDEKSQYSKSVLCEFIEQNWEKFYKSLDEATADWNRVQTAWMDNYFDTVDGVAYHPDGKFKLVLDSQHLRNLTSDTPLRKGALPLQDGAYESLPEPEFSKRDREKYFGRALISRLVQTNPFWLALARGDKALLNTFVDTIATQYQNRFVPDADLGKLELMGAFLRDEVPESPEMRALYVLRLEGRSSVDGRSRLDYPSGRLVGLAPEALKRKKLYFPDH